MMSSAQLHMQQHIEYALPSFFSGRNPQPTTTLRGTKSIDGEQTELNRWNNQWPRASVVVKHIYEYIPSKLIRFIYYLLLPVSSSSHAQKQARKPHQIATCPPRKLN